MNIFQWIKNWFKKDELPRLTNIHTRQIVTRYLQGETQRSLAKEFGITQPMVSSIINKSKMFAEYKKKEANGKRSRPKRRPR